MNQPQRKNTPTSTSTSYSGLRQQQNIKHIEIPLIQRDYAQGRTDSGTARIRDKFLEALLQALSNNGEQALDFIYGEVKEDTLIPLDGQQRLSTLFLLHWYLAARLNFVDVDWDRLPEFIYTTRDSAKTFCQELIRARPFAIDISDCKDSPNSWLSTQLRDQGWFRQAWMRDPTVSGMLVSLDTLHAKVTERGWNEANFRHAWDRLTGNDPCPPIHFELLQVGGIGPIDRQYIRMNARGKALTDFERFKAGFERQLQELDDQHYYRRFANCVDGSWTDLLWPLRNIGMTKKNDESIDDRFLCLIRYLGAFAIWQYPENEKTAFEEAEAKQDQDLLDWAIKIFFSGRDALPRRQFLFDALDALARTFNGKSISDEFERWFVSSGHTQGKVSLFRDKQSNVDLLAACVQEKDFGLREQLMLFGLLLYWMNDKRTSPDPAALRILRNLLWAWDADIDNKKMPSLVRGVEVLVTTPLPPAGVQADLAKIFFGIQAEEELQKRVSKSKTPGLSPLIERLEDHPLLKGCLRAFDFSNLVHGKLSDQVNTFFELFPPNDLCLHGSLITGALLTKGDYSCSWYGYVDRRQLGTGNLESAWVYILTGRPRVTEEHQRLVDALGNLLNDVAGRKGGVEKRLNEIIDEWVVAQERKVRQRFDWRYYLIKYDTMRSGNSGIYVLNSEEPTFGFDLCMLDKERLSSYYRDPYLTAVVNGSQIDEDEIVYWFYGNDNRQQATRWLRTHAENNVLRPDLSGWMVEGPNARLSDFLKTLRPFRPSKLRGKNQWLISVPQIQHKNTWRDREDRVELGVRLLDAIWHFYS